MRFHPAVFAVAGLSGLLVAAAWWVERREVQEESLAMLTVEVATLQQRMESRLADSLGPIEGIAMLISADDVSASTVLERVGPPLAKRDPLLVSLALAPDLVIREVFPFEPNQAAIGLDFRTPPVDLAAIRAFDTREAVLAGPFRLRQGGVALAIRVPYERRSPDGFNNVGLVSIAIDFDGLMVASGFEAFSHRYHSSLIALESDGRARSVIWGELELSDEEPITREIAVPGGHWRWQVDRRPIDGHAAGSAALIWGVPISLLLVGLTHWRMCVRQRAVALSSRSVP